MGQSVRLLKILCLERRINMRRFFAVMIFLSMILLALSGCGQHYSAVNDAQLKTVLAKYTKHQIVFFQSIDIGDNQNAAFAIVVRDSSDEGVVWYVTDSKAQKLQDYIHFNSDDKPADVYVWTVDNTKIFKCETLGGSGSSSYAWYIKGGKPVELPYTGMELNYNGNGQFITVGQTFDAGFTNGSGLGHTYKIYYLYWTADGLKEYGGLKITLQQLLKIDGAQAVIDAVTKSGNTIDEIYYRANNIININYHSGDKNNGSCDNVTLAYKNNKVTPELAYVGENESKPDSLNDSNLSDYYFGGIYQATLFPKIATYPDKLPIN